MATRAQSSTRLTGRDSNKVAAEIAASRYQSTVELAFAEMGSGSYAAARARFLEALAIKPKALVPNARVLRALGMVEYWLGRYASALSYLEQALRSQAWQLSNAERLETEQLKRQAYDYLASYTLSVRPGHARVTLDGEPLMWTAGRPFLIQAGDHALEIQAPGFIPVRRELQVESHKNRALDVRLEPLAIKHEPLRPAPVRALSPDADAEPLYASPWLWIGAAGLAVGAALVVSGLVAQRNPVDVEARVSDRQTSPGAVIQLLRAP